MAKMTARKPIILGIYPTSRGFGWAAFEGPITPYDWGHARAHGDKNAVCLRRIERLLARLLPDTVVLEDFRKRRSRRGTRVVRLCHSIESLAIARGIDVAIYTREQIRSCFSLAGAHTRHEIAQAIVRHVDAFRPLLPGRRKPWHGEHPRIALFSAAALVLTHYHLGATRLFEDLREA